MTSYLSDYAGDSFPPSYTLVDQYVFLGYVQQNGVANGKLGTNGVSLLLYLKGELAVGKTYVGPFSGVCRFTEPNRTWSGTSGCVKVVSLSDTQVVFDVSGEYDLIYPESYPYKKAKVTGTVTFNNYTKLVVP